MRLISKRRLKIGILFNFSPKWMGGVVYIINLIKTLNFLDDDDKPEIILFYRSDLKRLADEIYYPYYKTVEWQFPSVYKGYITSFIFQRNVFVDEILKQFELDGLYPFNDFPVKVITKTKIVSWYADLQHKHYPEFFSRRKITERNARIRLMLRHSHNIVVSSKAVAFDFQKFYPLSQRINTYIFHFVSVIDDFGKLNFSSLQEKYKLPEKYFMVSNQFHQHKNHRVLLKAFVRLNERGGGFHLAMTGRFPDASHSSYMQELHQIIAENNLNSQISFLGVIPRNEQLLLMKHSQAVLQPSLFEGWSTVIEDAKSLQVPVIASNIPVNVEQLGSDGNYFRPDDDKKLSEILGNFPLRDLHDIFYGEYRTRIKDAAQVFLNVFLT